MKARGPMPCGSAMSPTAKTRRLVRLRRPRSVAMPAGAGPHVAGRQIERIQVGPPADRDQQVAAGDRFAHRPGRRTGPGSTAVTTCVPSSSVTPRADRASRSPATSSGSSLPAMVAASTTVTRQPSPRRRRPSPGRSGRRPGSADDPGVPAESKMRGVGEVWDPRPGRGSAGRQAVLPAAMTMRRAVSRLPSTVSASGATKRASPRSTVAPRARNRASESIGAMRGDHAVDVRLHARPSRCPARAGARRTVRRRRAACAAWDAASSALLGTQPKLRQSPPMRSRSISATRRPSCAATAVTDRPAAPAPITARSNSGIASASNRRQAPAAATARPARSAGPGCAARRSLRGRACRRSASTSPMPAPIEA